MGDFSSSGHGGSGAGGSGASGSGAGGSGAGGSGAGGSGAGGSGAGPRLEDVVDEIARVAREELGLAREVKPGDDLVTDVQLDSVGLLTLAVALEDRFRVALTEEDAAGVRTVAELAALVLRRRAPEAP